MIGILLATVLSSSSGQIFLPGPNAVDSLNIHKQNGSQIPLQNIEWQGWQGGYGPAAGYLPTFTASSSAGYGGYYPGTSYPASYPWGYGGYYGYPGGYGYGYGGGYGYGYPYSGYGGYCGYPAGAVVAGQSVESKEHKEIKRNLDEIKSYLDKDIKGTLDKLTDSLKQAEKRIEASEKTGMSTETRVKWIEEEFKQRLFWYDMESKLDQRMKPLEQRLRELNERLEKHDDAQRRQHDDIMRGQQPGPKPAMPKPPEPKAGEPKPPEPKAGEPKPADAPNGDPLKSLEIKIDRLQGAVLVDISAIQNRLAIFEELFKEERVLRTKIEERLKNMEKSLTPKEEAPNDKEAPKDKGNPKSKQDAGDLPKVRVAQVSLSQDGVPTNKAMVVVSLPADAKLFLNGQLTRTQGASRSFVTPELEPGSTFTYAFRMEVFQNGAVRTQTQEVTFQAGQRINVTFGTDSEANMAAGRK